MKNNLFFLVLLVHLFFNESFSQHGANHLQCGTEHFALKLKQVRSASTTQYFQYIKSAKISPYVIRYGESFKLEVQVTENTVNGIQVQADNGGLSIEYQNQTPSFIQLYDDGSHGDAVSNDRVFTCNQLKISPAAMEFTNKNLPSSTFGRFFTVKYHFTNNSEVILNEDLSLALRFVPVNFSAAVVNQAESSVQYSSNTVNIVYDNQGSSFLEGVNLGNML